METWKKTMLKNELVRLGFSFNAKEEFNPSQLQCISNVMESAYLGAAKIQCGMCEKKNISKKAKEYFDNFPNELWYSVGGENYYNTGAREKIAEIDAKLKEAEENFFKMLKKSTRPISIINFVEANEHEEWNWHKEKVNKIELAHPYQTLEMAIESISEMITKPKYIYKSALFYFILDNHSSSPSLQLCQVIGSEFFNKPETKSDFINRRRGELISSGLKNKHGVEIPVGTPIFTNRDGKASVKVPKTDHSTGRPVAPLNKPKQTSDGLVFINSRLQSVLLDTESKNRKLKKKIKKLKDELKKLSPKKGAIKTTSSRRPQK